jgi:flagellar hook assembly protein FlgD
MRLTFYIGILLILFLAIRAEAQVGDSLVVHFKNGKTLTFALSEIQKITFDSLTESVPSKDPTHHLEVSPSFPNPAKSAATIDFSIPESGSVGIVIYDSKGNLIRSLEPRNCSSGKNEIIWDGLDKSGAKIPSGAYFYEVRFKDEVQVRSMVVIK